MPVTPLLPAALLAAACLTACAPKGPALRQGAPAPAPRSQAPAAAAASRPAPPSASPPQARAFRRDMLDAHNAARARARPSPQPALPPLAWSEQAARRAEAWAAGCTYAHNPEPQGFGENLAASTAGGYSVAEVVGLWVDEARDYDLARNRCAPGKVCGHYTQVVWRATTQVGCARKLCRTNNPFGGRKDLPWELWVCNYAPQGNIIGRKPY